PWPARSILPPSGRSSLAPSHPDRVRRVAVAVRGPGDGAGLVLLGAGLPRPGVRALRRQALPEPARRPPRRLRRLPALAAPPRARPLDRPRGPARAAAAGAGRRAAGHLR